MSKKIKLNWIPFISYLCILFALFSAGNLFGYGGELVIGVITSVGAVSIFRDHFDAILSFWTDTIRRETHFILIAISFVTFFLSILSLPKVYEFSIKRR